MIDLDAINVESANWATERVRKAHPLPSVRIAELPPREAKAFLVALHEHVDGWLGVIGALRRPGRVWVDVLFSSGRWSGRWVDDCPTEAAVMCAYWTGERITLAGVGVREAASVNEYGMPVDEAALF